MPFAMGRAPGPSKFRQDTVVHRSRRCRGPRPLVAPAAAPRGGSTRIRPAGGVTAGRSAYGNDDRAVELHVGSDIRRNPLGLRRPPHTDLVALTLNIILIGLGCLLAAGSGLLWFRENPGRRLRWASPKPSWRSTVLYIAGMAAAVYGWSNLQVRHQWDTRWVVVAAVFPLSVIAGVIPRIVRRQQLRRSGTRPADPISAVGAPPAV